MAKKSKKRPSTQGREYPGCVASLLNIFHFHCGRSTIRLIPDRRPLNQNTDEHCSNGNGTLALESSEDFENKEDPENSKISVKELMEAEMIGEGDIVNLPNNSQMSSISKIHTTNCLIQTTKFDKLVYETILEHLVGSSTESSLENDFSGGLDMLSAQAVTVTDRKLVAAVKLLMEQKAMDARNSAESPSGEEFMDAVKMLMENYSLFVELLQELNSFRCKQALPCLPASNLPHEKLGNTKTNGYSRHKQQSFLRKESRSLESFLQGGNEDYQSSLAVLEPSSVVTKSLKSGVSVNGASLLSFYMYKKEKNESFSSFRFSFTDIKRKLWHALGKDKTVISSEYYQNRRNCKKRRSLGWMSANRQHFYSERYILSTGKNEDLNRELKENGNDTSRCQRLNIYIEAKKHIYQMLKDGDEDSDLMIKQLPKSLGMILAAPDPKIGEAFESLSSITEVDDRDVEVKSIGVQTAEYTTAQVAEVRETVESSLEGAGEIIETTLESFTSSTDGDFQHGGIRETACEDSFHQTCLESDLSEEDQVLSSPTFSTSHSPVTSKAEGCKSEQPSPVSVLESLFMDVANSPASSASEPARETEPHHLNFEEQGICRRISMEIEESPFEYVEAVLLGSGLDWDDFHSRWLSSHEILDSSLFDEVELFSNRSRPDQRFLFDSANEALTSLCDIYFSKQNYQQIPGSMDLIDQIWKWMDWHIVRHTEAKSMDQLAQMDLARCGKWMNLHREIKAIGFEIMVTILNELMEDTTVIFHSENEAMATLDDD